MKMIKLNQFAPNGTIREVLVNPNNITYIFVRDGKTFVQFSGTPDNGISVKESKEDILNLITNI